MCVPVPVGLGKPAPGTMGSLSWGKDPRKDCGILRQKIKQNALYTSVVKRKKYYGKLLTCYPCFLFAKAAMMKTCEGSQGQHAVLSH